MLEGQPMIPRGVLFVGDKGAIGAGWAGSSRPESARILVMKKVSIQVLKAGLSAAVAEAQAGAHDPDHQAQRAGGAAGPARTAHVHQGARVGMGRVHPALKRGTRGRYLAVLLEDRGTR